MVRPTDVPLAATIGASLVLLALVGWLDWVTGQIGFLLFYLAPVGLAAWFGGRRAGLVLSASAAAVWLRVYIHEYGSGNWAAAGWETGIALGSFATVSLLLSALKASRRRREAMAEELARSNRELQEFARIVSHDLQEPLRTMAGFVQLLQDHYRGRLGADADEYIAFVVDGAARMKGMIKALLEYSRVGRGGEKAGPVSCQAALEEALANLRQALEDAQGQVTWDPLPTVVAYGPHLTQVFQNLVGNAVKFRGELPPVIHVGCHRAKGEWVLSVRDNGIGFDPKQADRLFQVFQRLHTQKEYPGFGIGLSISKKVVEGRGGRIWVESEEGRGACFFFTIPDQRKG